MGTLFFKPLRLFSFYLGNVRSCSSFSSACSQSPALSNPLFKYHRGYCSYCSFLTIPDGGQNKRENVKSWKKEHWGTADSFCTRAHVLRKMLVAESLVCHYFFYFRVWGRTIPRICFMFHGTIAQNPTTSLGLWDMTWTTCVKRTTLIKKVKQRLLPCTVRAGQLALNPNSGKPLFELPFWRWCSKRIQYWNWPSVAEVCVRLLTKQRCDSGYRRRLHHVSEKCSALSDSCTRFIMTVRILQDLGQGWPFWNKTFAEILI